MIEKGITTSEFDFVNPHIHVSLANEHNEYEGFRKQMEINHKSEPTIRGMVTSSISVGNSCDSKCRTICIEYIAKKRYGRRFKLARKSNYQTMASNGVKAVTTKATEGNGYTTNIPYLSQQVPYAQQEGLSVNFYHFVHFTSIDQAQSVRNSMLIS